MKTDYEVEGGWSTLKNGTRCRACGEKLIEVPKEGHYNSKYWKLKKDDRCLLLCCPNNCSEEVAVKKIREYSKIKGYCTLNSESWNYKLDYHTIYDAWIDKRGKVYPFESRGHINFAWERNTTESLLEKQGWLKLTNKEFFWHKKLSKRQIDMIFDYIMVMGVEQDIKEFKECIDVESYYIKIGE